MNTALTIAGSDSSGGAGIQADIKTMTMNGVYAMSAITSLTAQNTLGVTGIFNVTPEFLEQELDAIFSDIRPDAVKIGMVSEASLIRVIGGKLQQYGAGHIVLDPVMIATSGARLVSAAALEAAKKLLLPMATVITPNLPEAEMLLGREADESAAADALRAAELARELHERYGCAVLVKGGHGAGRTAVDVLFDGDTLREYALERIEHPVSAHGTGCSLAAAIAAELAAGKTLADAVQGAKDYVHGAIANSYWVGEGCGVLGLPQHIPERGWPRASDC